MSIAHLPTRPYSAKVLLFGEYTTLLGTDALAVPLHHYSARWLRNEQQPQEAIWEDFVAYLQELPLFAQSSHRFDIEAFRQALVEGWRLETNIPIGYGLGSSGVVVAAVYDAFMPQKARETAALHLHLTAMEHFFHGSSSGIDPLTAYSNQPVWLRSRGIELPFSPPNNPAFLSFERFAKGIEQHFFLLDSGLPRSTKSLVGQFLEKSKAPDHRLELAELGDFQQIAVQALLKGREAALEEAVREISARSLSIFADLIPSQLVPHWRYGLSSKQFSVKLCGAGGGGMFLVYAHQPESTKSYFSAHNYHLLPIQLTGNHGA